MHSGPVEDPGRGRGVGERQAGMEADPAKRPDGTGTASAAELRDWTLAQIPIPLAVYDHEARLVEANDAMGLQMGMSMDKLVGKRLKDFMPLPTFAEYDRLQEQVIRTGETVRLETYGRAPGDTREHAWTMYFFPLKDETGRVHGVSAAVFDTTEQFRARERLAVLNEASKSIGSTLDVTRTAQELAEASAGRLADFVSVDLFESVLQGEEPAPPADGQPVELRRTAQQSVLDGAPESAVAVGSTDNYPDYTPFARGVISGRATRHSVGDPVIRRWIANDPIRARVAKEVGVHSLMFVPLRARGTTLGMAFFVRHRTPDPFSSDDLLLADEITARAAVSIDNARRFTRERKTSLALQRSLLPQRLPRQAAVEVASRYLPADSQAGVGGDWFDVIQLSSARVALVVGDVVGHGIHASAHMGRLRTAVRTLADVDLPPAELLTQLDDLVLRLDREQDTAGRPDGDVGEVGATCLYAVYDPISRRATVARAGHPPPVIVRPDGTADFLDLPQGPRLGVGGLPFESAEVELPEGSLLALYTDGLVESAERSMDDGFGLLRRTLQDPGSSLEDLCEQVIRELRPNRRVDDIALVLARTRALDAGQVAIWDLEAKPAVVAEARKRVSEQLSAWGLGEVAFTTELVVSELVTNAIRYAGGPIQLRLIHDATLIVEVSDASSTAPHLRRARVFDEGGRGLLLVAQLTQRWGSRQTPAGKTIWAEQTLGDEKPPVSNRL
ncbi:MAG: hypothetical protein QOI83_1897 [Streptomycetaceae bacterium]|nr:hypothetical protein [Streptomycetaceae bacterium]